MATNIATSTVIPRSERTPICKACNKVHPTAAQRRDRGETLTDYERTCVIALKEGISHAEAAA